MFPRFIKFAASRISPASLTLKGKLGLQISDQKQENVTPERGRGRIIAKKVSFIFSMTPNEKKCLRS